MRLPPAMLATPVATLFALVTATAVVGHPTRLSAQAQQGSALRPEQQLAHDIYKELVEINTTDSTGNVTTAATAVAGRFSTPEDLR